MTNTTSANKIWGRSAFLELLKQEGVSHMFGNPGTTELPIMHALAEHPDLTYVLGLQEALVVAMADGYSRASGKLVACNVHVAPGLGNAMGSLYNAKFTNTPMILTAGQQEQGHGLTEPVLYGDLVSMARPLVKWAVEVTRLEDLPRIIHRAAKVAMTPPMGPVFLSLPGDILNDEAGLDLGAATRIDTRVRPSDDVLEALAKRILAAENPVVVVGDEMVKSDALAEGGAFATALGAPVFQSSAPYGAQFLNEHPCFMGALERVQKQARAALEPYDLMIALGADPLTMSVYSPIDPLPDGMKIVQIGLDEWDIAKNYPVEIAALGDLKTTLPALAAMLAKVGGDAQAARAKASIDALAATNWSARRARLITELSDGDGPTPIDPRHMAKMITDVLPDNAIIVNEGLTSARLLDQLFPFRDRFAYHGLASGGIGWGLPAAVGVQIAQPDRPVVAVIGDGSAMYSIQALWTAAAMKLPLTYVIANNGGYRIIKQRLKSFHGSENYIAMDFVDPPIDFVAVAQGMGLTAERITDPARVRPALTEAIANPGPNLLEIVVDGTV
ncbi:thiamine pyrophosphate-binding protein [Thalassospiraceae bacterium LMO-SO8]|nr:thiamine pyrophosphate-dependent enzyme [Alphaproteobacteria bacterium LMO-S08]WND75232.1 thiamine pyrophosphate-binding protein [Thalassospiraceae bacterium LMO-SO8]